MVAIIMGLNAAPVQRLKRSWELVSAQYLAQLGACEAMIDSHRNFKNYHQALATISPPCVPYIGELSRLL
jgi:son of sevenless